MHSTGKKIVGYTVVAFLVSIVLGPFLVPVPELEDTKPVAELAGDSGRFLNVRGFNVYYERQGSGPTTIVLLHGFGASVFSWREVVEPLSSRYSVVAYDRPAFGLTERPLDWDDWNPYGSEEQIDLLLEMLDKMSLSQVVLIGNSAGGTVAARFAVRASERVKALILVSPAVYTAEGMTIWLRPLLRTPQMRHLGPRLVRGIASSGRTLMNMSWHDPSRITTEIVEGYRRPLTAENWDVGLWFFTSSSRPRNQLSTELAALDRPILIVTGDDDRVVPTKDSVRLAREINAPLRVIEACGHLPQEECPDQFLRVVDEFLSTI